jgi:hypothetical protein
MLNIFAMASLALLTGALLGSSWVDDLPLRTGWIGLAVMLASAWVARRYWRSSALLHQPGSPERALWHGLVSYGLVGGHLASVLWRLGPVMDMHSRTAHALAIDSWTLVLGGFISYGIARDPEPRRDERDALFAMQGLRTGHGALVVMLLVLIVALGFGERTVIATLNHAFLAHVLVLGLTLQCMVQDAAQLRLYRLDVLAEERTS